jgi:hypothetical protein
MSVVYVLPKDTVVINVRGSTGSNPGASKKAAGALFAKHVNRYNKANGTSYETKCSKHSCSKAYCRGPGGIEAGHVWCPDTGFQMLLVPACSKKHNKGGSQTRWKVGTGTIAVAVPLEEFTFGARLRSLDHHLRDSIEAGGAACRALIADIPES